MERSAAFRLSSAAQACFSRRLPERVRVGLGFIGDGRQAMMAMAINHYLATDELVVRLGLGDGVPRA